MSGGVPAARVGDPIAHSHAGRDMVIGALIGLAAGAVLVGATIASGGAALAVVAAVGGAAGLTSFGGLKGMFIGEASMGPPTGQLVIGSNNVRINGRFATMTERGQATCDDHSGPIPLATGAATVLINGLPAGRIGENLGCSALVVAPCSPDVLIGGPSVADPNVVITPEVPAWAVTGLQMLGIAGAVMALPYAIATVGVAATIGGGVASYFGGEYGGKAGRALGTAMGMSETGIRSMEAGGQFFGGMLGGAAGVKSVQAGEGALAGVAAKAPLAAADEPFPFMAKKIGEPEAGAVSTTPELEAARDAAKNNVGQSASGYPDLPDDAAKTFGPGVRPWNGDEQTGPIRRVVDQDSNPNGSFWQSEVPNSEDSWRGGAAVKNGWNGDGGYVEANPAGLRGWVGSAAPQDASVPGMMLPGDGEQIWLPPNSTSASPPIPTSWNTGK